jgi:hypothetical protein
MRSLGIAMTAIALTVCSADRRANVPTEPPPRPLQLHLADYCEKPIPNRIEFQRYPNEMPLCAERTYEVDDRDFSKATLTKDDLGEPAVSLCFSGSG